MRMVAANGLRLVLVAVGLGQRAAAGEVDEQEGVPIGQVGLLRHPRSSPARSRVAPAVVACRGRACLAIRMRVSAQDAHV